MATTYRTGSILLNRIDALSLFIKTCKLAEPQLMTAARAWTNGLDTENTAGGRTLRDTVRKTSAVVIIPDTDERASFVNADFAVLWALFTDERTVAISSLKSKGLSALNFGVAAIVVLQDWLTDNYAVTNAARDAWLDTNKVALGAAITTLQAA